MTQDELKQHLNYNPETGVFVWRYNPNRNAQWNFMWPGKVAGSVTEKGYCRIRLLNKGIRAHRLAFLYVYGYMPKEVDHIDGDKLNNKIDNLRDVTHSENMRNAKKYPTNTTGVTGVTYRKSADKWLAYITVHQKRIHGGIFNTKEEAVAARQRLEKKYDFHENHGR